MSNTFNAGVSIVDISPKEGISLAGYPHHPRYNKGIHDPLYAACLYLENNGSRLLMITMDMISFSKKYVRKVRNEISGKTGIQDKNIQICCSHSHSAPRASLMFTMDSQERGREPDADFVEMLISKITAAGIEAASNTFEARIGIEKGFCGREQGVGGNRRDPMGLADPEVWTIGVQDIQGKWRAVYVKYALHPTFLHSDNFLVSADYPGYIRKYLSEVFPEAVFLFAQGTSGNQSPRYFRSGKTFEEAERVGRAIGKEAVRVLDEMVLDSDPALFVYSVEKGIDIRTFPNKKEIEKEVETKRREWQDLKKTDAPERDIWNAELRFLGAEDTLSLMLLHEQGGKKTLEEDLPVEITVVGIGDTRIVGLQGEIFVEFGMAIQYRSPHPKCFVVQLMNGSLPGYAATTRAYAEGGYETGASMLTGKSGDQMVEAAVELLGGVGPVV
jgi:neutral ceramidase